MRFPWVNLNIQKNMKYCFKSVPNVCKYFFFVRKHEKQCCLTIFQQILMNAQVAQKLCNKTLFWVYCGFRACLLSYHHQSCLNLLFYVETTNFCIFLVSVTIRHNSEAVPIQLVEKYAKKNVWLKRKFQNFYVPDVRQY